MVFDFPQILKDAIKFDKGGRHELATCLDNFETPNEETEVKQKEKIEKYINLISTLKILLEEKREDPIIEYTNKILASIREYVNLFNDVSFEYVDRKGKVKIACSEILSKAVKDEKEFAKYVSDNYAKNITPKKNMFLSSTYKQLVDVAVHNYRHEGIISEKTFNILNSQPDVEFDDA